MRSASEVDPTEEIKHLLDPSSLDAYALDEHKRRGPKYGVILPEASAALILSRFSEELEVYKVSSLGYNNRLYFVASKTGREFVIKICGRYWKRVKTETEVVGLYLAGELSLIPAPRILAWDSTGLEFGVEYTVMRKVEGIQLREIWDNLSLEEKRGVIAQLAKLVVSYKSIRISAQLPQGKIGNFLISGVENQVRSGEMKIVDFEIGPTLEGLGPWTSYKAYLKTQFEVKMENVRKEKGMECMGVLLPRVERLLEILDIGDSFADCHQFVFTHGDLTLQNVLVSFADNVPTVTALLDWEWSGMFPAEEEFFCSFDFLLGGDSCDGNSDVYELRAQFFSILEDGGVETPPHPCSLRAAKEPV